MSFGERKSEKIVNRKNLKFVYSYFKQHKLVWLLGIILTAIAMAVKIRYSWLLKDLIDGALIPKDFALLLKLSILFPLLVLVYSFFTYLKEYCFKYVSQKSIIKMRADIFSHVLRLSYRFFVKNDDGDIISRLINDVENAQEAFSDCIVSLISSVITIVFVLAWLFYIHVKLALLMLIIVPIFVLATRYFWKQIEKVSSKVASERGEMTSFLQQTINSIEFVKLVGSDSFFIDKLSRICQRLSNNIIKLRMNHVFANSLWESILTPYQGVIFLVAGIWYITADSPSIGTIMAFMNYINLLIPAMLTLINDISNMAKGVASLDRLHEYLAEEPEKSGDRLLSEESGINIEFKNVYFQHSDTGFAIKDLNLTINDKDFVAIVGHTGSGKSTLTKLLVRLYDVDSGEILINGVDIKEYDLYDLRKSFGFVQQDIYLLKGTIKDNLIYSNLDAAPEQIQNAIKIAQLDKFIDSLPLKLDTVVGERGATLSGGEKQRLSIARILLKDCKILILDEPTSALDLKTEKCILEDMDTIFNQTTTIAIDHRLATVDKRTKIIVMVSGQIVEQGSYKELVQQGGEFCKLVNIKAVNDQYTLKCNA